MVRYSEELIDEIRNSNDIVDIISQYVILKRSGRNFFGLCPFHKEKTPSFSVSPDKQIFHCFGCGAGGNVIHFISKIENVDFKESLEILADRVGIKLPTLENNVDSKRLELKEKGLSTGEKKMLLNAKQILVSELTLAENSNKDQMEELINKTINNSFAEYSKTINSNEPHNIVKTFIPFNGVEANNTKDVK